MPAKYNSIAVRTRNAADEPFLGRLYAGTGEEAPGARNCPPEKRADFLKVQSNATEDCQVLFPNAEFQIVLIDGEASGQLVFNRAHDGLVILDISLTPERRNAGIGAALLLRIFGEAAATRKPVRATVRKGNRALRFFERQGFAKIGETDSQSNLEWRAPAPVAPAKMLGDHLRLRLHFEPALLQADLAGILAGEYIPHFNTGYFEGDWSAVPLRSVGGSVKQIYPDPSARDKFADTALLARCPYVREALAMLACPKQSVRFLRLKAGSVIREHRDYELGFEDGEVRLHVPVVTNPAVEFVLNQVRVIMNEGECWYLNVNLPHRVANRGATDRIHLVVDCVVNDWLRELLLAANASATPTS